MSLIEPSKVYKPFLYPQLVEAAIMHDKLHWIEAEADLNEDVRQWKSNELTKEEKYHITSILRLFTQSDMVVGGSYVDHFLPRLKNNEARMLLLSIAQREVIHQRAYALLNDTLGLPEEEYSAFLKYPEMATKADFMSNFESDTLSELGFSIAKTVCNEGVSLFSSFAMLLNYQRMGKMKGMCEIVEWSIRDEGCFADDTEILTESGWKLFKDLSEGEKVAQWDEGSISFVAPTNIIAKDYVGNLIHFSSEKAPIDQLLTPDHRVLFLNDFNGKNLVREADDFTPHSRHWFYNSGKKVDGTKTNLEPFERILIALQADGTIPKGDYRNGNNCGHRRVAFNLTKERKKVRMRYLCELSKFDYTESVNQDGSSLFFVNIPTGYPCTKNFADWVDLKDITDNWCKEFVEELVEWDGHRIADEPNNRYYYSSTVEDNVSLAQTIACLAGYYTSRGTSEDKRKSTYKTVYRLYITKDKKGNRTGRVTKDYVPYDGKVYCVSVPSTFIVVRRNGNIVVSGNCHAEKMALIHRIFCGEHPRIVNDVYKKSIYELFKHTVELEDAVVDLSYRECEIKGLDKEEVKQYIRYMADRRLNSLGLKEVYGLEKNPLPWIDSIVYGDSLKNFFEGRVTDYNADGLTGNWKEAY